MLLAAASSTGPRVATEAEGHVLLAAASSTGARVATEAEQAQSQAWQRRLQSSLLMSATASREQIDQMQATLSSGCKTAMERILLPWW